MTPDLTGLWLHSFEEDEGDIQVFRPESYPLPLARGRRQLRFGPNGTVEFSPLGRGDAPEAVPGAWRGRQIEVSLRGTPSVFEIVEARPDILRLRQPRS